MRLVNVGSVLQHGRQGMAGWQVGWWEGYNPDAQGNNNLAQETHKEVKQKSGSAWLESQGRSAVGWWADERQDV